MGIMRAAVVFGLAVGCISWNATAQSSEDGQRWDAFVKAFIETSFTFHPEKAAREGRHEFDGKLPDWSRDGIAREAAWLRQSLTAVQAFDPNWLDEKRRFEHAYVSSQITADLFWLEDAKWPFRNPFYYQWAIRPSVYLTRDYAPLEQRMAAYIKYAEAIPRAAKQIRTNLDTPLPMTYVKIGRIGFGGLASFYRDDVPHIFESVENEALQEHFREANAGAIAAMEALDAWFEEQETTATDDYAMGAELFAKMLRSTERVDVSLDRLKAVGETDLERNLGALRKACADLDPSKTVEECIAWVQAQKPDGGPVQGAKRQLKELKAFLLEESIVTIPGPEEARVDESPPYMRWNAAYIDDPGVYETHLGATYYIAPPDPSWSPEQQLAYIPGETYLLALSVHEVWPGHFLQFMHSNRSASEFGRLFGTYAFIEGWAHYTEELVMEAGLRDGDPATRIGQLLNALLRNVRYLSAIGLHTEGMTVEQSEKMFLEKACADPGTARQQAARGTFDPQYLNYTLGKLMIRNLRDDWCATRGNEDAWCEFHDTFLSFGAPPIPLVREFMLGDDAGPVL
jgi:hypothetical protein